METDLAGEKLISAKLLAMSEMQFQMVDRKIDILTASPYQSADVYLIVQEARNFGIAF